MVRELPCGLGEHAAEREVWIGQSLGNAGLVEPGPGMRIIGRGGLHEGPPFRARETCTADGPILRTKKVLNILSLLYHKRTAGGGSAAGAGPAGRGASRGGAASARLRGAKRALLFALLPF